MNKAIENYIKTAMEVLAKNEKGEEVSSYSKEYKGYLSSFGASVMMSGLIPTLAFYANTESNSKSDRNHILIWMFKILKTQEGYNTNVEKLFDYARKLNENDLKRLEKELLNISIALKLAIRTFKLT